MSPFWIFKIDSLFYQAAKPVDSADVFRCICGANKVERMETMLVMDSLLSTL